MEAGPPLNGPTIHKLQWKKGSAGQVALLQSQQGVSMCFFGKIGLALWIYV